MKNKIGKLVCFIFSLTFLFNVPKTFAMQKASAEIIKTRSIEDFVKENLPNSENVIYTIVPRGLIISVATDFLFLEGSEEIHEEAYNFLYQIGSIIKYINKPCVVEGNAITQTDDNALSNMELSIIRADEIVEFLIKRNNIDPLLLRSIGFGAILPFKDNVSYKGHMDKRIDFVIFNYESER